MLEGSRTPPVTVGRFFNIHGGHGAISYNTFCRIFNDKPSERSKPGGVCVCLGECVCVRV